MGTIEVYGLYLLALLIGTAISAYVIKWICIAPLINELSATRKLMGMHSVQENILTSEQVEQIETDLKNRNTKV